MRKMVFVVAALAAAAPAAAQTCGYSAPLEPFAYEAITVSSTAVGFTATAYGTGGATPAMAYFVLDSATIRFRVDGGTPTSTVGHLVTFASNVSVTVCGDVAIKKFRAIRTVSDASLKVTYYKLGS